MSIRVLCCARWRTEAVSGECRSCSSKPTVCFPACSAGTAWSWFASSPAHLVDFSRYTRRSASFEDAWARFDELPLTLITVKATEREDGAHALVVHSHNCKFLSTRSSITVEFRTYVVESPATTLPQAVGRVEPEYRLPSSLKINTVFPTMRVTIRRLLPTAFALLVLIVAAAAVALPEGTGDACARRRSRRKVRAHP